MTAVEDFINEGAAPAERMIRDLVACEHAYINTDHPGFVGGNRAIAQARLIAFLTHALDAQRLQADKADAPLHCQAWFTLSQVAAW
jgi:Dynamin central region